MSSQGVTQLREAIDAFQRGDLDLARAMAEREVAATPSPQWRHLLGLIHCRLGDPGEGVDHLRAAAEAEPGNIAFQVMLVRALTDAGRAAEAVAMPEPGPATSPASLELWRARGEAANAADEAKVAEIAWAEVTAAAPRDWRAWNNLGNALASQKRWSDAGYALSKAASINPTDLTIRRNAGSALAQANRLEDALPHFQAVAATEPDDSGNRISLAHILAGLHKHDEAIAEFEEVKNITGPTVATEVGIGRCLVALMRYPEAEAAFKRAYELDPTDRSVVHHLGIALDRNNQLEAFEKLLEDALAVGLGKDELSYLWAVFERRKGNLEEAHELLLKSNPDDDPIAWYRQRAKIADALGNAAEAFEAAEAMNRTARDRVIGSTGLDEWERNAKAYREEQHQLARTITPEWASRVPLLKDPSPKRVAFLVGFPRSGTTLLDTFLMGHPEVTVLEEEQLVGKASLGLKVRDLPTASTDWVKKARAIYLKGLAEHVGDDFEGLVVDKFPLDMAAAPLIQAMFPGAPIIFAQRHPCDVVLSGFMQSFGMVNFGDVRDAADYYDAMMSIWTASVDAMKLNTHTVVYEDLVRDQEAVLKPVIDFLGLEWDDRLLDHRRTAKERGTISTPSYDQVTEPISTKASGRWKRYEKQLAPVLPVLLPWARRLGYTD